MLQLWYRPWAGLSESRRHYMTDGGVPVPLEAGACWLHSDPPALVRIGDHAEPGRAESWLVPGVTAVPQPLRPTRPLRVLVDGTSFWLDASALPVRPEEDLDPENDSESLRAKGLLDRVKSVWARLRDVEATLEDPAQMWRQLQALWLDDAARANPEMDIIVRHARLLPPTLDVLDRAPRRILRRTHEMVPLARVQEVDRRAMMWLIRQPGESIAERAGFRQRIQAVAREESFNTLENRVVLSYARMAHVVAREYRDRHVAIQGPRVARVRRYGGRCRTLERDLRVRGVFEAGADVMPNFVLQNDARYRAVWDAWHELLRRRRILDELWRWQVRSWEEFCALVVVIALQSRPGARPIAISPIVFREEQQEGCWIEHINPLAALFLPEAGVVVEVTYRSPRGRVLAPFGAPIWLRLGRIDSDAFLSRWAIWPIWHADGGLMPGEGEEIGAILPYGRNEHVAGGMTLRPVAVGAAADEQRGARTACFTIGAAGAALQEGIIRLGRYLDDCVLQRTV